MKDFVVSRLLGGMGNQMFEYAFARALSLRNGMELYLDACALDPKRHTRFSLGAFNVGAPFVDAERKSLVITPRFEIKRKLYKALKIRTGSRRRIFAKNLSLSTRRFCR